MDAYVNEANVKMDKSIESFKGALGKLRSGRANPAILEGINATTMATRWTSIRFARFRCRSRANFW
jgi:ribosome recycling factor